MQRADYDRGLTRDQIVEQLDAGAADSKFDACDRNWFEEGPHIVTLPELPRGDEVRELSMSAFRQYMYGEMWETGEGARRFEADLVGFMGTVFHLPEAVGRVTTGGSESDLIALLTAKARAFAREYPELEPLGRYPRPFVDVSSEALVEFTSRTHSVVLPKYAHYSIYKGCALMGLEPIPVEPKPGTFHVVDPADLAAAVRDDTIALFATAGVFPYGCIDPVVEFGEIAAEHDIYLHVDACFGGFIIPFLERAGYYNPPIPPYDFRVPAVSSMSADLHKNGMCPPPASMILFRDPELLELAKVLTPPNGTLTGTRACGPIAAAWAMVRGLGVEGYKDVALVSISLRDRLMDLLEEIPGIHVFRESKINLFIFYSDKLDLRPVVDELSRMGWVVSTKPVPGPVSIVICTLPQNSERIDEFAADVKTAIERVAVPLQESAQGAAETDFYGNIRV